MPRAAVFNGLPISCPACGATYLAANGQDIERATAEHDKTCKPGRHRGQYRPIVCRDCGRILATDIGNGGKDGRTGRDRQIKMLLSRHECEKKMTDPVEVANSDERPIYEDPPPRKVPVRSTGALAEAAELALSRPGAWVRVPGLWSKNVAYRVRSSKSSRRAAPFRDGEWDTETRAVQSKGGTNKYRLWIRLRAK